MKHTAPGRHPLHAAVFQQAFVALAVLVQHAPGNHVSDGFKPTVRVVRKARNVIVRVVAAKVVQHQKWV